METTPIRLVLVTPVLLDPARFRSSLEAALAGGDVAAVILDLAGAGREAWRAAVLALGPVAQAANAAFLVRDHVGLVGEVPCDGAHVTGGAPEIGAALRELKPGYIVGAGDATTRHAAMSLGECRPDYIFLGRLDPDEDVPARLTLVEWWTALFELPCVALAAGDWDSVRELTTAGADFIALRDLIWGHPDGPGAAVGRAQALIADRSEAVS